MNIRKYLTYANVVATLALFFALGGGAYAVSQITSGDIKNDSVKSADLRDRKAVKGSDVKRDALGHKEIAEQSLDASRFARLAGSEDFPPCNPESAAFVDCASATISLQRPSRLLIVGTAGQQSEGAATAECEIRIDDTGTAIGATPGEITDNTASTATNGFARTLVTPEPIAAGSHEVALACNQGLGDVRIQHPTIAAIAIATK